MSADVVRYLAQQFPNLQLGGALFYSWPIGMRFDLGGRAQTPEETDFVIVHPPYLERFSKLTMNA
jgi:hypothetical protein